MIALKTVAEIAKMREAGRCASALLEELAEEVVSGATTDNLVAATEKRAQPNRQAELNTGGRPSQIIVEITVNEELVGGNPAGRILEPGDLVTIDVSCRLDGWWADTAGTYAVGSLNPHRSGLIRCAEAAANQYVVEMRPGRQWTDVVAAVESMIVESGFVVLPQFEGHGIGRELHEDPRVPHSSAGFNGIGFRLTPGLCITVEPVIGTVAHGSRLGPNGATVMTADGSPAVFFEHTIAVSERGAEVLTRP